MTGITRGLAAVRAQPLNDALPPEEQQGTALEQHSCVIGALPAFCLCVYTSRGSKDFPVEPMGGDRGVFACGQTEDAS